MGRCRDFDVCGLDDAADPGAGCCILHAPRADKDPEAFARALQAHRDRRGDNYTRMVFPVSADFSAADLGTAFFHGAVFLEGCDFSGATFTDAAFFHGAAFLGDAVFTLATFRLAGSFSRARFQRTADFRSAAFHGPADFSAAAFDGAAEFTEATFDAEANFSGVAAAVEVLFRGATFTGPAEFRGASFRGRPCFHRVRFVRGARFAAAEFAAGADFHEAIFEGEESTFAGATFAGQSRFSARREAGQTIPVFAGTAVDFRGVRVLEPGGLLLQEAELRRCRLLGSDAGLIDAVQALWPTVRGRDTRDGAFDELAIGERAETPPWGGLERLYRDLSRGADRVGERVLAGDFRYGQLEARRRNPTTPGSVRGLLALYAFLAGYGERFLRPLVWAGLLWLLGAVGYLSLGLVSVTSGLPLDPGLPADWLSALHFSLAAMTLTTPWDLVATGWGRGLHIVHHLAGPLLLALLAQGIWRRIGR